MGGAPAKQVGGSGFAQSQSRRMATARETVMDKETAVFQAKLAEQAERYDGEPEVSMCGSEQYGG